MFSKQHIINILEVYTIMALLKIEHTCSECNNRFILAVNPKDQDQLSCCPFCGGPVDYSPEPSLGGDEAE